MAIDRFGLYTATLRAAGDHANPYVALQATAELTGPTGPPRRIGLFWDGAQHWVLRFSPDLVGSWRYRVRSFDAGLDGAEGAFECRDSSRSGGLVPMVGYPRHFQRQSGTPVWLFGDTNWRALATDPASRLDRCAFEHYIDVRSSQGFNYIHTDMMGGAGVDGGQKVFHDFSAEEINLAFFREVDERIAYMNGRGITCGLVLAWGRGTESWAGFASDEARLRYARYIVARYSAFDVVFVVAGEWDLDGSEHKRRCQAIGREIMSWDPHGRMRAIHPCRARSAQEFATEPWMSFGDYQQQYRAPKEREATTAERRSLRNHLLKPRTHGKPVVNAEYAYFMRSMAGVEDNYARHLGISGVDKEHSHTRDSFRRASWVLAMAGGYFVTGFGSTYFGGWRERGPFDVDAPKNDVAVADLIRLLRFFADLPWWRFEPLDDLVSANDGYACCLAELGDIYVVYAEGCAALGFWPDAEQEDRFGAKLFDPRTGDWHDLGTLDGTDHVCWGLPDGQDWVLLIQRTQQEYYAPRTVG